MVDTPKVIGPDGVARDRTFFSTTIPNRFFQGTLDSTTVDLEISIRGGPFTSDPDYIVWEGDSFMFPNPAAFPEGLELTQGNNRVEVRSIGFGGNISSPAVVEVTLVQESDVGEIPEIPTNVSIEQFSDYVAIQVEGPDSENFVGMNFYASRFEGGGSTGYQRVNLNVEADVTIIEEDEEITSLEVISSVATNPDGTPAADPLYVKIRETQTSSSEVISHLEDVALTPQLAEAITETEQANLLKTDFVETYEVPETTTRIKSNYRLATVVDRRFYTFNHDRLAGPASSPPTVAINAFQSLPNTAPLYYVATAVYYDPNTQLETESPFSIEVLGAPVTIQNVVGTFPAPSRIQVATDVISNLRRTQPTANIAPGGVIRDTFVDPMSSEAVRMRLLVDFLYRSQSFDTLLQVDGVQPDGTSTPVSQSPYKQGLQRVFGLSNPNDVQVIIDTAFDQLAQRENTSRSPGDRSRGLAVFFRSTRPTSTIAIPLGTRVASGNVTFLTVSEASLPVNNLAAFFNPSTGLYSVEVEIQAEQPGKSGDLTDGQIRTVLSPLPGLSVTNPAATFGGRDRDTNLRLSEKARSNFASVDSGSEQGTRQVAASVAGVESALVISGGDSLMQRDYDPVRDKHVGGKVDVWVKGESIGQVTDNFVFTYEVANDVQFGILGNPFSLVFRSLDKTLTPENPINQMIDRQDLGLGLRNAVTGQFFNLTGVQILDYRTIQLSSDVSQPTVSFGDVILGDYRYQATTDFVFTRQPVDSVISVAGEVSGDLDSDSYRLINPDDPLQNGRSSLAQDFLRITPVNGVPSGETIVVQNEQSIMIGEADAFLDNLGANVLTIRVYNLDRTVEYRGPNDPSGISDFTVIPGGPTTATALRRTTNSSIDSGETVLVDYEHDENFSVAYEVNSVLQSVQNAVDKTEHITADTLAKEAIKVPVDITATIAYRQGAIRSTVDSAVRTNLVTFINSVPQKGAIRQSDVIAVIDNTVGVSFVQTPLTKLLRGDGARVVRESVLTAAGNDTTLLLGNVDVPLTTDTVQTFILNDALDNATENGGGDDTNFQGVFQDDLEMNLITGDPFSISGAPGQAYIIGNQGLSIPGFSDDTTILAQFPALNTDQEIEQKRRDLTANRVLVSLSVDDRPQIHSYKVTYTVTFVEEGVEDLLASELEYFVPGEFTLTYTEDSRGN